MKKLEKYWWLTLIRGIVLILLAFFTFRHPVNALVGLAIYIGIGLLFTGITQTAMAIMAKDTTENWGWVLAGGIFEIVFAFILLTNPLLTATTLPFILGFWVIVYGVMTFANSFPARKAGMSNWWLGLISGILSVILGILISNNLLFGAFTITVWIGIALLIAGIVVISEAFALKSLKN